MPEAARGASHDQVNTVHVSVGFKEIGCDLNPTVTSTAACSSSVFVEGYGIVRQDDPVTAHNVPGCSTHAPGLSTYSSSVIVDGKGAGRKGDQYGCGATITSGAASVIIG